MALGKTEVEEKTKHNEKKESGEIPAPEVAKISTSPKKEIFSCRKIPYLWRMEPLDKRLLVCFLYEVQF